MKSLMSTLVLICALATMAQGQTRLEYSYGPAQQQTLDIYTDAAAPAATGPAPMIVMLHGGAWRFGDKRNRGVWRAKVNHWLPAGYVFASVNTRLLPDADPVMQAQDLAVAVSFLQNNAAAWNADPERLILMGHSAGAHVAGLLATRDDIQNAAGLLPWRGTVLLDTAALDVTGLMQEAPAPAHRRAFGSDPAFWAAASPLAHLDQGDGPFLIVCATSRQLPCPMAQEFQGIAAKRRVAVTVQPMALSHRLINTELGNDPGYTQLVSQWIHAQLP